MIERKCTKCNTWNKAEDYCRSCGMALSPKAIDKAKEEKRLEEEAQKVPSKFDLLLKKMKNSNNFLMRSVYYIFFSITIIMGAIGAFLAWMVAIVNG